MEDINREGLHSIGEISMIVKISTDTLRYYDDINLLKPIMISKQTGYRYYSNSQVTILLKILELKQYGFSLNEIKDILSFIDEPIVNIYKNRYFELLQEKSKIQDAINMLSKKIEQEQEAGLMNKSILLVDDAAFMRMMCCDMMQKQGYQVIGEAGNGIAGVEQYKLLNPDLVVLDIVMPEMNGIDTLREIKKYNNSAKAVMCSAMGQPVMVIDSLLAGASDFVVKPFQADRLLEAVSRAFTEEKTLNAGMLKELRDKLADSEDILSQSEIDDIINCVSTCEALNSDVDEIVRKYEGSSNISTGKSDDLLDNKILSALENLAQGQEEIKELLKQVMVIKMDK